MRTEQAIIVKVLGQSILCEDDFGEAVLVPGHLTVGAPRVGATVTLVTVHGFDRQRVRAFVEPEEMPARISSEPDESGVVFVTGRVSQLLKAHG